MPDVVGVVFHNGGKVYYFDPGPLELESGEQVVVQTMRGTEIGEVAEPPREVPPEEIPAPLKQVVRKATAKDLETLEANEGLRREALAVCRDLVQKHKLNMKLIDAEIVFGGGKIVFSFFSEERVDFRALVADLARALKMRIELRQVGAREEARMIGGLGPCGRNLCCRSFNVGQDPVSIRMAKEQNLPLNPMKISGLCGRLMCCLKYEQDQYVCFRKSAPKCGTMVDTPEGQATVVSYKVPKESLTVRYEDGTYADVPLNDCSCGGKPCGSPEAVCGPGGTVTATLPPSTEAPELEGSGADGGGAPPQRDSTPPPSEEVEPAPVESSSPAADGCLTEGGFEVLVACDAPVWTPDKIEPPTGDLASVEDPPEEPPLGASETLVEADSEVLMASQDEASEESAAGGDGSRPESAPEPGSRPESEARRTPRRRRRRRPRRPGGGGDPSTPSG